MLHEYKCRSALRFWLALWCALDTKSLKTIWLQYSVFSHLVEKGPFSAQCQLFCFARIYLHLVNCKRCCQIWKWSEKRFQVHIKNRSVPITRSENSPWHIQMSCIFFWPTIQNYSYSIDVKKKKKGEKQSILTLKAPCAESETSMSVFDPAAGLRTI